MSNSQKLIFDVETIGIDFDSLDDISREQLQKYFERYSKNEEEVEESKDKLGFWPLTGEIVAIGALNPDTGKGIIYLQTGGQKIPQKLNNDIALSAGDEKDILQKFWEAAEKYNYFITFNGRTFDAPYLMIRSAINGVRPTKNLMANRYLSGQNWNAVHVDLADQFIFYGAVRRNFSLHFWSKAFGLKSPKEEGITGDDVKRLYQEKKFLEIAEYNLGDLLATRGLYEKWQNYLNFSS